jgi:hypothetical protein
MSFRNFERDVRELLELQGWTVDTECVLGHKKIDAYAEKLDSLGSLQRVAVECKAWERPLTQSDVSEIYASYHPLIDASLIDLLLIVTVSGLAPSAETYVEMTRNMRHLTRQSLLNTLINFRGHLQGVIAAYLSDDVSRHYIAQSFEERRAHSLEEHLLSWIESDDSRPVAILGGYGIGKSTLCKRMAFLLAQRAMSTPGARVPVVLSLSSIATDQTLEGLLGRQFTSTTVCPNYNYQLFLALNRRGCFVIFLDGFDEMRKTILWDAILYNLGQLHQLVGGDAKVVLLGRPSAFLSEDEEKEALHGIARVLDAERRVPDWPDYRVLNILPFSRRQVSEYLKLHLETLQTSDEAKRASRAKIASYLSDIESPQGKRLIDLASRPVQLHMLVEILPEYTGSLDRLTVAILYSEFIDLLLRREAEKQSRASFTRAQRRRFASQLAFELWKDRQKSSIDSNDIPTWLFKDYVNGPHADDLAAVKRDLLNGGFVERRPPNTFYFPHRSFQEFLVADELANIATSGAELLNQCPYVTPEICNFFAELAGEKAVRILKKKWEKSISLSGNLRELLNFCCARYGLGLLYVARPRERSGPSRDTRSEEEKEQKRLLRKLDLVGVVDSKMGDGGMEVTEKLRKKNKHPNFHRKHGITRKGKFR